MTRELDDLVLDLRTNEAELGTWVLRATGDAGRVLAYDQLLLDNPGDWLATEIVHYLNRHEGLGALAEDADPLGHGHESSIGRRVLLTYFVPQGRVAEARRGYGRKAHLAGQVRCRLRSGAAVRKDAELVPLWVGKYDPALIALADVGVPGT